MKKKLFSSTTLLILILLAGLSLLLYPKVSDYWNSFTQSQVISNYVEKIADIDEEQYAALLEEAKEYNRTLLWRRNNYVLDEAQRKEYEALLNISGIGVMGYIEIPTINCSLPIYHGTDDAVLQIAVGHMEWTSLPVGGEGTHCVLSGHRGLPSAELFTDLNKVVVGDLFMLRVLNEVLTYEVDQILIVEPHETEALLIEEGQDYCTLVTCTPYGINSHRLLVRGHRVENEKISTVRVTADAVQIEPLLIAPLVAIPILLILLIVLLIPHPKKKRRGEKDHEEP